MLIAILNKGYLNHFFGLDTVCLELFHNENYFINGSKLLGQRDVKKMHLLNILLGLDIEKKTSSCSIQHVK